MELDDRQAAELTGTGECFLHWHPDDRAVTSDTVKGVAQQKLIQNTTTSTTITYSPDIVTVDTTAGNATITLPLAKAGNEVIIVKTAAANTVTVLCSGANLIFGSASTTLTTLGSVVRLKGISTGYIMI